MGEPHPVALVGLHGGEWFGAAAGRAVQAATILAGSRRHLDRMGGASARRVELGGDLGGLLDRVVKWQQEGHKVCLLASGDPGFFGLARLAAGRLGPGGIAVHPAPSSVAMAAARAGTNWDDAIVVSAHGRPVEPVVEAALRSDKVAVLCSPEHPPESVARRLLDAGCPSRSATVASRMGEADEGWWVGDLPGLAERRFDPLSVVILAAPGPRPEKSGWRWGRPEAEYAHRAGMITKSEVRAVALGKLGLLPAGVMWDVGAGSGSVAAECSRLAPGLRIFAIERNPEQLPGLRANLHGTTVSVVEGWAPAAFEPLPDPDRVFVGGGGIDVLSAALKRLRPGGQVVATYASMDRAVAAAERLGNLVEVSVSRGVPVPRSGTQPVLRSGTQPVLRSGTQPVLRSGTQPVGTDRSLRLAAENPVFVCWGPEP